ncbi:hypothetical protein DEF23_27375, partial [Marinitenerispora sediminis]
RTVVVFVDQVPNEDRAFNFPSTADILRDGGAAVFRLRHDRHLARTTTIDPRRLAETSRTTAAPPSRRMSAVDGKLKARSSLGTWSTNTTTVR